MNYKEILNNILEESDIRNFFSSRCFQAIDSWPDDYWKDYFNSTAFGLYLRAAVKGQIINDINYYLSYVLSYILILMTLDRKNAALVLIEKVIEVLGIDRELLRETLKKLLDKYAVAIEAGYEEYQEEYKK